MKASSRFTTRALAALAAAALIGVAGACDKSTKPPVPVPPPPPAPAAPTNLSATATSATQINLAWTDASSNEDGFKIQSCSGAGCTNFAEVGAVAANVVTFSNTGLTASTGYSYRALAHNTAGNSAPSNITTATTLAVAPPTSPILVGAGEITNCATTASIATGTLVEGMLADTTVTVFTAGNNLTETVAGSTYETCFDTKKWGTFKARTYYAIGNGDFEGGRAAVGVYNYLGDRTGPRDKGWFSFDRGTWHIIVLNTSDWQWGATSFNNSAAEQVQWLATDLAANTKPCVMVISWERRIYTTTQGARGRQSNMLTIGSMLYGARVDVLVSAKDKLYARFPRTDDQGVPNDNGFRQFLVGTGGTGPHQIVTPSDTTAEPISPVEVQGNAPGVLKFTLDAASYTWQFMPATPGAFTDTGTTNCH